MKRVNLQVSVMLHNACLALKARAQRLRPAACRLDAAAYSSSATCTKSAACGASPSSTSVLRCSSSVKTLRGKEDARWNLTAPTWSSDATQSHASCSTERHTYLKLVLAFLLPRSAAGCVRSMERCAGWPSTTDEIAEVQRQKARQDEVIQCVISQLLELHCMLTLFRQRLTCKGAADAKLRMGLDPSGRRTRRAVLPGLLAAGSCFRAARLAARLAASMAALSATLFASAS